MRMASEGSVGLPPGLCVFLICRFGASAELSDHLSMCRIQGDGLDRYLWLISIPFMV